MFAVPANVVRYVTSCLIKPPNASIPGGRATGNAGGDATVGGVSGGGSGGDEGDGRGMHTGRSMSPGTSGAGRSRDCNGMGQSKRFFRPASKIVAIDVSCASCVGIEPLK